MLNHSVELLMLFWQWLCGTAEELAIRSFPMGHQRGTQSDGISFHSGLWSEWSIKAIPLVVVKPVVLLWKNCYSTAFEIQQAPSSQSYKI